jgi:hypothetical protein
MYPLSSTSGSTTCLRLCHRDVSNRKRRHPNDKNFTVVAMKKEVDDHTAKKHWKIIRRDQVPEGVKVLPAVWVMKHKRWIQLEKYTSGRPAST